MSVSKAKRERLFAAQSGKCFYCCRQMGMRRRHANSAFATLDHVNPRANGGTRCEENIVLACRRCNEMKGSKTLDQFVDELVRLAMAAADARRRWETRLPPAETPAGNVVS